MRTLTTALVLTLFGSLAYAAPTLTFVSQTVDPSGSLAPGTEYNFFASTSNAPDFSSYLPTTSGTSVEFPQLTYASVIPPGQTTAVGTGLIYNTHSNSQQEIFTFNVNSSTPSSFNFYLLDDNGDNNGIGNDFVAVSVDGGAQVSHSTVNQESIQAHGNLEFTEFNVTDATSADTFTVYATSTKQPSLGGITYSTPTDTPATVPEPSTYALLLGGLVLLAIATRRRSAR